MNLCPKWNFIAILHLKQHLILCSLTGMSCMCLWRLNFQDIPFGRVCLRHRMSWYSLGFKLRKLALGLCGRLSSLCCSDTNSGLLSFSCSTHLYPFSISLSIAIHYPMLTSWQGSVGVSMSLCIAFMPQLTRREVRGQLVGIKILSVYHGDSVHQT